MPVPPGLLSRGGFRDGEVDVAIRPEALRIGPPGGAGLAGTVVRSAFMGAIAEYAVSTSLGELFLTAPEPSAPLAPGTPITLLPTGRGIVPVRPDVQ